MAEKTDKRIEPRTLKGFRDFLPEEQKLRQAILAKMKASFELFGFDPLETPTLEYAEILNGKYGEDEKLIYSFVDHGGRNVAMRYDQTVPLARVVAQYPNLPRPFKRYQVQPVWRADNTARGRYREFFQCDVDTVGSSSLLADADIIACVIQTIRALGFQNFTVLMNDRVALNELLQGLGISAEQGPGVLQSLDKLAKIGREGVAGELARKGFTRETSLAFLDAVTGEHEPPAGLAMLFSYISNLGIDSAQFCRYAPSLARGLNYYTGSIFEVVIHEGSLRLSVGGGGRYDNLIGIFANKQIPAVGFAFGFDRLVELVKETGKMDKSTTRQVLVVTPGAETLPAALQLTAALRNAFIPADIYPEVTKLDRALKYANQKGISYVAIVGSDEVASDVVTLKDMQSGEQARFSQAALIARLKGE